MNKNITAAVFAIAAAALYALNIPLSKLLLQFVGPTMMASLLYFGAGIGLIVYCLLYRVISGKTLITEPLTRAELPYTAAMVILDIAAPIFLMFGVKLASSANVSLLNNFEIVATSLIALIIFKEYISKRLWAAIALISIASVLLGFEGMESFVFNEGSFFVLAACLCWGFENNCTRKLSGKSSIETVIIKGCFSGLGSMLVAMFLGETFPAPKWLLTVMLLGFVAYGLSINFYILAQKELGAAKTSAYYSVAPFLGVGFSILLLGEKPNIFFYIALIIMFAATVLIIRDTIAPQKNVKKQKTE